MERVITSVGHFWFCHVKDWARWCHWEPYVLRFSLQPFKQFSLISSSPSGVLIVQWTVFGMMGTSAYCFAVDTVLFSIFPQVLDGKKKKPCVVYSAGSWDKLTVVTSRCSIGHINCDFDCGNWRKDFCHSGSDFVQTRAHIFYIQLWGHWGYHVCTFNDTLHLLLLDAKLQSIHFNFFLLLNGA